MWKNSDGIREQLLAWDDPQRSKLLQLWMLTRLVRGTVLLENAAAYSNVAAEIPVSDYAREIFIKAGVTEEQFGVACKIWCLRKLFHEELLIDVQDVDLARLTRAVSDQIEGGALVLPQRFARSLYDSYAAQFPYDRIESLPPDATKQLLAANEGGVFQIGRFLAGPLGLFTITLSRLVPPTIDVPLWHCDNIGCNHLHDVELNHFDEAIRTAFSKLNATVNHVGPASHWSVVLSQQLDDELPDLFIDLAVVLQDCLADDELQLLFGQVLTQSADKALIWSKIAEHPALKSKSRDPKLLIPELTRGMITQLLLLASDDEIISALDTLILSGQIKIPPSEVRKAKAALNIPSHQDGHCSISSLGIRADSTDPIAQMAIAVWDAYDADERLSDLAWRTRRGTEPASAGDVLGFLNDHSPLDAVDALILPQRTVTVQLTKVRKMDPELLEREPNGRDVLLWKLGFNVSRFNQEIGDLLRHLAAFKSALLELEEPLNAAGRERLRSVGVNLFVHLEYYLEHLIAFNVWLLAQDHLETAYVYNPADGIQLVGAVLPNHSAFEWNREGGNTLGVLLAYANSTAEWMSELGRAVSAIPRSPGEYPHYAGPEDKLYPLHHQQFWADADPAELASLTKSFAEFTALILRSNCAGIRNGLDHYRRPDEFPSVQEMFQCEALIRQAVETANARRLYPLKWWLSLREGNQWGGIQENFSDETGRPLAVRYPSILKGLREANRGDVMIIPHGNLLGQPNAVLMFKVVEPSAYTAMWENYPTRPHAREEFGDETPPPIEGMEEETALAK